jgi:hypothetical protein
MTNLMRMMLAARLKLYQSDLINRAREPHMPHYFDVINGNADTVATTAKLLCTDLLALRESLSCHAVRSVLNLFLGIPTSRRPQSSRMTQLLHRGFRGRHTNFA